MAPTDPEASDLDPFAFDHLEAPYDLYRRLRERSPVHELPELGLHLVSRHADVVEAATRHQDFSSQLTAFVQRRSGASAELVDLGTATGPVVDVLATADQPDHTRQRKVVAGTLRQVATSEARIEAIADDLVGRFVDGHGGDWTAEVAARLPVHVIADLLGLPSQDVDRLASWSDAGVELLSGVASDERMAECAASVLEFARYLDGQLTSAPEGSPDGILALLAAGVADGEVSTAEARSMALQLVAAGSDSTGNLIGSAVRLLTEQPDVQDRLRADPGLVVPFLEEVVRLESPFRGHFRVATRDTELGGVALPAGTRLFLLWASANRDPEVFDDPDEIRLDRSDPRRHLGFGWGIHKCVGAPLARLESRIVVERLLATTTSIRLDAERPRPRHVPSLLVRRVTDVHVLAEPAR